MSFKDNKLLIEELIKGNEDAYLYLVNTYSVRLFAYAITLIGDHALSQDILQNVFLKTWRHRGKLNPKYSIQSFLYRSVYNEFINQYRHNEAISLLEKKYSDSLEKIAINSEEVDIQHLIRVVNKEIDQLPARCKKVFVLSKQEGLTNIEISKYLGISVKTVESQITKAFKVLREKLADKMKPLLFILFDFKSSLSKIIV